MDIENKLQIIDCIQQSKEWFEWREKYPLTASHGQAIANAGAGLTTLCYTNISEKYSSAETVHYSDNDTERGNELEPPARSIYELKMGLIVVEAGFIINEVISSKGGVSVDGLVGDDGLLEIKCPKDEKYFRLLINPEIESKHNWQMQMQMLFTDRKWCDYVLFNPNFKQSMIIQRVERDEEKIEKIKLGLKKGEEIIKEIESKLK